MAANNNNANETTPKGDQLSEQDKKWANPMDITDFSIDSYIKNRWADQHDYFDKKAIHTQKWYIRIQLWIIVLSAVSVLVLSIDFDKLFTGCFGYDPTEHISIAKSICAICSLFVVIISGYDKLKQYHTEWISKRKADEKLKVEICKYKFGVAPYKDPSLPIKVKEDKNEESEKETDAQKKEQETVTARTKLLFQKLNSIVEANKDIDSKVNDYYRAIKNEISAYVSSADAYQEYSNNPFTKRDKLFVDRVNDNSDDIQKLITQNNYFSLIKKEISDYNIGEGAYKPTKSKPSVDPQKVRDEILWDNMRTFVDRVEAIISSDVDDFVNSKNKLSELGDSFNLEKEIKAIKESIDKKNKK